MYPTIPTTKRTPRRCPHLRRFLAEACLSAEEDEEDPALVRGQLESGGVRGWPSLAPVWRARSETWMPALGRANIVMSIYSWTAGAVCLRLSWREGGEKKSCRWQHGPTPLRYDVERSVKAISGTEPVQATAAGGDGNFRPRDR